MKIISLIANGSEEIEALSPVDVLRRADVDVDIVSISKIEVCGSHNIVIKADKTIDEIDCKDYDGIIIPGGMPGATNISNCKKAISIIKEYMKENKLVASICASPAVVLASNNLLCKKKATCFPSPNFIEMIGENYTGNGVEIDGNLVTANGPKSAMDFSIAICKVLNVKPRI